MSARFVISVAQSSDALLDKLVEKGILTTKEATELRQEADQNFNEAYKVKTGLPDWVDQLKLYGDFRGRMETFNFQNDAPGAAQALASMAMIASDAGDLAGAEALANEAATAIENLRDRRLTAYVRKSEANIAAARLFLEERLSLGWTNLDRAFADVIQKAPKDAHVLYIGDGIVSAGDTDASRRAATYIEQATARTARTWNPLEGLRVDVNRVDVEELEAWAPTLVVAVGLASRVRAT